MIPEVLYMCCFFTHIEGPVISNPFIRMWKHFHWLERLISFCIKQANQLFRPFTSGKCWYFALLIKKKMASRNVLNLKYTTQDYYLCSIFNQAIVVFTFYISKVWRSEHKHMEKNTLLAIITASQSVNQPAFPYNSQTVITKGSLRPCGGACAVCVMWWCVSPQQG